jgi:spermidine/putrescine transport system permease protein
MVKLKGFFEKSYLFILLAILYAPLVLILIYSFSNSSNFNFSEGFSFEAYISIFTSDKSPELWDSVANTVIIASVSSVFATILGTFAAIGIFSMGKRTRRIVENVNQFPIINSEIVMAVSFMVFFVTFAFPEGYLRLIIAHIAFCTPYVVLSVLPKLESMDPHLYEAALDMGAKPFTATMKVMFPLITPGIISGFLLSFTLSLDDFIITQINKGTATGINTLSTYIYSDARVQGLEPFWYAIFSIIFVAVLAIILSYNLVKISRQKAKAVEKERKI